MRVSAATRFAHDLLLIPDVRRSWFLRIRRPENLFQPHNDTSFNRYPEALRFLRSRIDDDAGTHLMSFGCSTGDEVFTIRHYFPASTITGIDISTGNIRICRQRQRAEGDGRMQFKTAGRADAEPSESYDAVLCMAVLRHGDLSELQPQSCARHLSFAAFESTCAELAQCVRSGGYLAIEHSNFRFGDTPSADQFDVALRRPQLPVDLRTPQYDRQNQRIEPDGYRDVIFRKR
jgi:hypothetical protein